MTEKQQAADNKSQQGKRSDSTKHVFSEKLWERARYLFTGYEFQSLTPVDVNYVTQHLAAPTVH